MTSTNGSPAQTRRPGRIRLAVAAATATILAALPVAASTAPAACHVAGHTMASGTVIKVDARGNAWTAGSNVPGPVQELTCTAGAWVLTVAHGAAGGAR
jgi:hypothetical protein